MNFKLQIAIFKGHEKALIHADTSISLKAFQMFRPKSRIKDLFPSHLVVKAKRWNLGVTNDRPETQPNHEKKIS